MPTIFSRFWTGLLIAALYVSILSACSANGSQQITPTPLPPLVSYDREIFTVRQGSIVSEKDLLGEIVPAKQDPLYFRSSGFVTRITVRQGDLVKAGDVLAELQIDDHLAQLQQAQIDLDVARSELEMFEVQHRLAVSQAQAEVAIAEKQLELAQIEVDKANGAAKDSAQLNYEIAEQNLVLTQLNLAFKKQETIPYVEQVVKRSELAVQRLESLLAERQIIAPYDGIILEVKLKEGQNVEGYREVIEIGDPSDLVVRSPIDWEIRDKLAARTDVELYLSYSPEDGDPFWTVTFLQNFVPISEAEAATSTASSIDSFYFDLHDEDLNADFSVGQSVFLKVILGRKDSALLLPPAAIREYKGLHFVIVQDGERRRRVEINQVGLKSADLWEVIGDLQPGDQVIGP